MRDMPEVHMVAIHQRQPGDRPFEHVFVATDFSAGAARAVARAGRLPLAEGGKVSLVHVLPDGLPRRARVGADRAAGRLLEQATAALARTAASAGRGDLVIGMETYRGKAYVEIIRHARAVGADLVVLGRHGRRAVRDMFIGSTAERVVRLSDLPVLIVSRKATRSYRRPLLAIDLDGSPRTVVDAALRLLGPEVHRATMVTAYQVPFEGFITPDVSPGELAGLRKEYRQAASSGLARFQASLGGRGVRWQALTARGDPRTVILAEAQRRRADLLAVGTHGRKGLSHALIGSVAEWVIRAAPCDVLVARPAGVSFELA